MMKRELIARILSCLLVVTMIVTLAACDRADDTKNAQTEEKQESGKILIAYFTAAENSGVDAVSSASYTTIGGTAVGRLRAVAEYDSGEYRRRPVFHSDRCSLSVRRWGID